MKKKGVVIIFFIITIIVILTGIIILSRAPKNKDAKYVKSVDEGDVTRYEWMKMLCEQEGLIKYKNEMPYFSDVNKDSIYFLYLQSAVEWRVLDTDTDFDGEGYASGRFIALTAMKTIGEHKLQIQLDTKDTITDDTYIELAIEYGLIQKEQLIEGLSMEECEQVLETLEKIYFSEFWKDDYSNVIYQDGVMELVSEDILQSNVDCSEIVVTDNISNSLKVGTIIVFEQENTKLKFARKITRIDSNGTLSLSSVELEQVVESFTVSDITELTFEDIVNYYGLRENAYTVNNLKYQQVDERLINTAVFQAGINSKGFKLSLSVKDDEGEKHLEIQATDNATGVSYTLPIETKVEADSEYSAEINIDKICVGGQISYSVWNGGLEYADVAVDAHATFKGTINADEEKKILLFKTPVPLGSGCVGADIQIYLVLSVEGSISFEAELPVELSTYYEKDKGLRNYKPDISVQNPTIEVNCNVGVMLRLEPTLILFGCLNVMDAEADIGVTASANVTTRPDSQICADISVSFPIVSFSVCGDDSADTLIKKLGLSAEWEIISSDDAPFQLGLHYEVFPNQIAQFVKECTYSESKGNEETKNEDTSVNTYYTRYGEVTRTNSPVFSFKYPDNWIISKEEVNGDSTIFGEYAEEIVELTNERNIKVTFIKFDSFLFEAGARGHYYVEYEATKMTDAISVLPDDSTNFVVAKLTEIGAMIAGVDSDLESPDSEYISYALMPENDINRYGGSLSSMGALTGYYEMISFNVPAPYVFFAEAPNGQFTEEEEKEVIEILSSFKIVP